MMIDCERSNIFRFRHAITKLNVNLNCNIFALTRFKDAFNNIITQVHT